AFGGPVKVSKADVGVTGTSLEGVQLFEPGEQPSETPWLTVERIDADVSLLGVVTGATAPRELTLDGVSIFLQVDRDGRLLTRLPGTEGKPGTLPTIRVRRGQVRIKQEGRPEMLVRGIDGELRNEGGALKLTGTVADSFWGDWTLAGTADPNTWAGEVTLRTPGVHATQEKLEAIPFVPASVWEQVQAEGDTSVEFTLRRDAAPPAVHYRVALEPVRTRVEVAAIDLKAADARGGVVIDDGLVQLRDVRGRVAGGELRTTADL